MSVPRNACISYSASPYFGEKFRFLKVVENKTAQLKEGQGTESWHISGTAVLGRERSRLPSLLPRLPVSMATLTLVLPG